MVLCLPGRVERHEAQLDAGLEKLVAKLKLFEVGGDHVMVILIMSLIIGSNGAYHWAGENSGFAVPLLAAFATSWCRLGSTIYFNERVASQASWILLPK
jgi:hypothetical protein